MIAPRVGMPDMRHNPFTPQERVLYWGILPDCGVTMSRVGSEVRLCFCLSYPCPCISFVFCCGDALHLGLRFFSKENYLYVAVNLLCPWEKVSSGSFYTTILDVPQFIFISERSIWLYLFSFLSLHCFFIYFTYIIVSYFFKYFIHIKLMALFPFCCLSLSLKKIIFL